MSEQFWRTSDAQALEALATKLTDYKFNKPDEFEKIVNKERQQLQGAPAARSRFEKFLISLPNTPEEAARKEQRRINLESLRFLLSQLQTRKVTITETTKDEQGTVLQHRKYTATQYVDKGIQAFYEWALRQPSFNTREFDPAEAYKEFFKAYLGRLPKDEDGKVETRGRKKGKVSKLTKAILAEWDETRSPDKTAKATHGLRKEEMSYKDHKDLVIRAIERERGVKVRQKRKPD